MAIYRVVTSTFMIRRNSFKLNLTPTTGSAAKRRGGGEGRGGRTTTTRAGELRERAGENATAFNSNFARSLRDDRRV